MAFTTLDSLATAISGPAKQRLSVARASIATTTGGQQSSYWVNAGTSPTTGVAPTTAAICSNVTAGTYGGTGTATGSNNYYIAGLSLTSTVVMSVELHDRLAHMGGLVGNVTTTQTVGIDLNASAGTSNLTARVGLTNYSQVQWFIEHYVATGVNATVATVAYTNQSGSAGSCTVSLATTRPAACLTPIIPSTAGDNIRAITSITLSVATAAAGNIGITATVEKTSIALPAAGVQYTASWSDLAIPTIPNSACLFFVGDNTALTSGALTGTITIVQG